MAELLPLHNLPPRDYERFVGRQKELAEVRRLLQPRSRAFVVTIDGIGGIGKSALALEAAYTFCDNYTSLAEAERFEALVWVSAKHSYLTADGILERRQAFQTLSDLYAAIAQVLDFPAITRARAEEQRAIVEQVLGEQRTLLILDNLETVDDEHLMLFLRELPDPTKAIVTTRHRIDVAYPIRLTGMSHPDAMALISQESARKGVALLTEQHEELWQRTGGMPLAIVWSIGLMGLGGSIESVLRRLGSGQSDIARFCFAESAAQIRGRDAYWLLLALSLFAVDASREALGIVAGLADDAFGRDSGLEELLRLSLVNKDGNRFGLLPLTQSFVQSEAEQNSGQIEAMHGRMQEYFYALVREFGGWSKNWRGQDRVEHELPNILLIIDSMLAQINYLKDANEITIIAPSSELLAKKLLKFLTDVAQTCRLRGYWAEHERISAIRLEISRALANQEEIGWSYYELSKLSYVRGDSESLRRWANEARSAGQRSGRELLFLLASRNLGEAALFQGNVPEAAGILPDTLRACEQSGLSWMPRYLYGSMGRLAEQQGEFDRATIWYERAINSFESDNAQQAFFLLMLGRLKLKIRVLEQASIYLQKSLAQSEESGRADVIAQAYIALAELDFAQQRPDQATRHARLARDLFRRLGMHQEQAEAEALLRQLGA